MIELREVSRHFRVGDQTVKALDEVSLRIESGQYVSIMGPSGSGKSTLLNLVGLLDRPNAGSYWLNQRDVTSLDDVEQAAVRNREIGFVFQMFHLVPRLTAAENVALPLVFAGVAPAERERRVEQALIALGIADRAHHRPDQLSGGQRQRVAIARATIAAPRVLLADEPTGNLDQRSGADVVEILEGLVAEGLTLIVVTHDQSLGDRAERQLRMVDGRIAKDVMRPGAV